MLSNGVRLVRITNEALHTRHRLNGVACPVRRGGVLGNSVRLDLGPDNIGAECNFAKLGHIALPDNEIFLVILKGLPVGGSHLVVRAIKIETL